MIIQRILEPGDEITLKIKREGDLCFHNDVGGTAYAPPGEYPVLVEKVWYDYETGHRATGYLTDDKDVATMRKLGTTPWKPKKLNWQPGYVMFAGELE